MTDELVAWADGVSEHWSVTFIGPTGCGKTWLGVRLMFECAIRHIDKWVSDHGCPAMRARFIDAAEWVEYQKNEMRSEAAPTAFGDAAGADLLFVDDLGCQRTTEYAVDRLSLLLRHRHAYMLPTIITTNTESLDVLAAEFDARVASRMAEGLVKRMSGQDQRAKRQPPSTA